MIATTGIIDGISQNCQFKGEKMVDARGVPLTLYFRNQHPRCQRLCYSYRLFFTQASIFYLQLWFGIVSFISDVRRDAESFPWILGASWQKFNHGSSRWHSSWVGMKLLRGGEWTIPYPSYYLILNTKLKTVV